MKKSFMILPAALVLVAACAKETNESAYLKAPEITAFQESDGTTKSILSVDGEGVGTIYWKPADDIKVFYGTTGVKYTSTNTENSTVAVFETSAVIGSTESASTNNWGLYPYDAEATCDGSKVTTTIPSTQYGIPETFDDDLFPTLAHSTTREFQFYNVCGGIKFSLSRADITKITFKGNNSENLAGKVDLTFDDDIPAATVVSGSTVITLTPKTGEYLAQGTNYYIITLPVSMTGGFTMTFETDTQIGTFNYTSKTVTVSRSKFSKKADIDTYATFVDKPASVTNLSASGTANCYIVSTAGSYKFKTVQGNSSTSVGDVKGVKVLWETFGTNVAPSVGDLIKADVSCANNYITFSTNDTYQEGNAVIAAYSDANCTDGNVLWSWHIWLTDQPEEQVYKNNAGTMMDRNLGATSANSRDIYTYGLLYQWGRKDPFLGSTSTYQVTAAVAASTLVWPSAVKSSEDIGTIPYSITNPTTYISGNSYNNDWYYTGTSSTENTRWQERTRTKGLYDPCPYGWRVPDGGYLSVWYCALGLTDITTTAEQFKQYKTGYDFGRNGGLDSTYQLGTDDMIWYPLVGYYYKDGMFYGQPEGYYWSCSPNDSGAYYLQFIDKNNIHFTATFERSGGCAVRCVKDIEL